MNIYYYTLEEALRPTVNDPYNQINHNDTTQPNFKDMVNIFYSPVPAWAQYINTNLEFPYINECWQRIRHMFKRDCNYFWWSHNEYDVTNITDLSNLHNEVENRAIDFIETMYETKDKYIALIKAQEALKTDILSDIESSTEVFFNDTPQSTGTYTTEDYNTTYTKTVQSVNLGPVSTKLDEVDRAMNDIYDR